MKPKSKEEYEAEIESLRLKVSAQIEATLRLQKELETENRVIQLLTVAGFLSEEKLEQARELARGLK